jgi:hypothetical protein
MNINHPLNSRQLAILIQQIDFERREEFLEKAKNSKDVASFIKEGWEDFLPRSQ